MNQRTFYKWYKDADQDALFMIHVLGAHRLQFVLRLRWRSISVSGTTKMRSDRSTSEIIMSLKEAVQERHESRSKIFSSDGTRKL
jgi:hypothetical protein